MGTSARATGATTAAAIAAPARSKRGATSTPTSGLPKVPFTYKGERSEKNFHSKDSGVMRRSNFSVPRSMVPVACTTASSVLIFTMRVVARPSTTVKSATAQRRCTSLSSPNNLPTMMLPTLRAARSSICLLSVPSRTYSRISPVPWPSSPATLLPRLASAMAPSMRPKLFFISSILGNKADSCSPCTLPSICAFKGGARPSMRTSDSILPCATPNVSGASLSWALSITARRLRFSSGKLCGRMMCRPLNTMSISIAFQRSAANFESGSTLPRVPFLSRPRWALSGALVPNVGPRSERRSWLDDISPVSRGRGLPEVYFNEPCKSLWPTLPSKLLYSQTARSGSRLPVSRPSVSNGGVLGSTSPVSAYRSAMLAPLRRT